MIQQIQTKKLPHGWQVKKLGEVCEMINRGISPKYIESKGVCILNQKCIRNHKINFELSRLHDLNNKKVSQDRFVKAGDVLVNSTGTGTLGRLAQVEALPFESTVDSHITIIRPKKDVFYDKFFGYALISMEEEIAKRGEGCGGQTELSRNILKNELTINYPNSVSEQKKIVEILDKTFESIGKAKENAEQNLKNAKDIFESYLKNVFEKKGEGWEEKKLEEIVEIRNGKNQQAVLSKDGKYPILGSAGNVMGYATNYICEAGTTIIGRKGNISKPLFINERFWNVDTAFGFFPKNQIDNKLVYYLCLTINFKKMNRGTTIPSLVKSELQKIPISFPKSIKEQQSIVKRLDALSEKTKQLEQIYQEKITALEELKKAILQKAFNGELTN